MENYYTLIIKDVQKELEMYWLFNNLYKELTCAYD